ncbi:MAG: hypothetical protein JEY94_02865 [Melioribacteraceae bacterium]|nr:hypothetical protein [Melioribacteraceae bacterium]
MIKIGCNYIYKKLLLNNRKTGHFTLHSFSAQKCTLPKKKSIISDKNRIPNQLLSRKWLEYLNQGSFFIEGCSVSSNGERLMGEHWSVSSNGEKLLGERWSVSFNGEKLLGERWSVSFNGEKLLGERWSVSFNENFWWRWRVCSFKQKLI